MTSTPAVGIVRRTVGAMPKAVRTTGSRPALSCRDAAGGNAGDAATLNGWVHSLRIVGPSLCFMTLRDGVGAVQVRRNIVMKVVDDWVR